MSAKRNPLTTFYDTKRLIGRKFSSAIVQSDMLMWPFTLVKGSGDQPRFRLENPGLQKVKTFLPQQISAKVLEKLKEYAEIRLRDRCRIEKCVVTVPAYFNEEQIRVTREACLLADFECL